MSEQNKNTAPEAAELTQQQINELLQVRRDKLTALCEAGQNPYEITKFPVGSSCADARAEFERREAAFFAEHGQPEEGQGTELPEPMQVTIAGRMMSRRVMGKASFLDLHDSTGRIQVYVSRNDVGEDVYAGFKKWDIGDIIGLQGWVFRTKMGEISIHATAITLLSKSLLPLPEKYHGLRDTDTRYRQRYLDLIVNPEVRDTFIKRSRIISAIRRYLDGPGLHGGRNADAGCQCRRRGGTPL